MKKKLLVGLSVMCLVTTMLPNVVFADSETGTVTETEVISETGKDAETSKDAEAGKAVEAGEDASSEKGAEEKKTGDTESVPAVQATGETKAAATGLQITSAAGAVTADSEGVWNLSEGIYDVTGAAEDGEYIVTTGNVTLNLNNATIMRPDVEGSASTLPGFTPAISVKSGTVNLNLTGSNKVQGSRGCAGIYVAEGATLNVQGTGELSANGGRGSDVIRKIDFLGASSVYFGGGAGIGGNGMWMSGSNVQLEGRTADFGTVNILSGKITTVGGKAEIANAGGGAGIGSGGISTKADNLEPVRGNINISGGDVNATGSEGEDMTETGGGAAIGAGGATGAFYTANNAVTVTISGGTVYAKGGADGAGIGGGANTDGGTITISAGDVTAVGGDEGSGSTWGGAGIGGGDNGGITSIEISGGKIIATAGGTAAGIGAGHDHYVGSINPETDEVTYADIVISGTADVTAYGGSHKRGTKGGAAIGASPSESVNSGYHSIVIKEQAKVRAYAGVKAQAIGVGTYYETDEDYPADNITTIESTTDVWMFNQDTTWGPFWGCDKSDDYIGINLAEDATFPEAGTLTDTNRAGTQWSYSSDGKVTIVKDGKTLAEETLPDGFTLGNWATISKKSVNVTFVDGEKTTVETADDNGTVVAPKPEAKDGYVFDGWKSENNESYAAGDVITVSGDMTLTASWKKADAWVDDKVEDKTLALDLETVIDTQVEAECGADISEESQAALLTEAKAMIKEIMNGKTPAGLTDSEAAQIREALNAGQPKVSVKMIINVVLNGDLTEDEAAIKAQMKDGEEAQLWHLSIKISVAVIDGNNQQVESVDNLYLAKTDEKITFNLTTGDDYTKKSVRVLYIHDDQVKEAESSVLDQANGKISIKANEFSPYAIITKAEKDSDSTDKPVKPTEDKKNNGQNGNQSQNNKNGNNVTKTNGAVKTGDTANIGLWLTLFGCAAAALAAFGIICARKKR